MKEKCEKLAEITKATFKEDKDAAVIISVNSRGDQFSGIIGSPLRLSYGFFRMMHDCPPAVEAMRVALKAYEDGVTPTAENPAPATEAPAPTPTPAESDRRPIEINIEHLIGELKISGSTDEFRQVAREKIEDVLWQAAKTISAALR